MTTTNKTAHDILYDAGLRGRNFLTPEYIREYRLNADSAAELSSGRGIDHEPIYGVTVVWHGARFGHDKSQMFYSRGEAVAYIASLCEEAAP